VFRAYDKTSGEIVWETQLPAGTTGGPVSYVANGKQFIVVPVGGKDAGTSWIALGLK
jgi:quinoprotein glucose dehydrogenase